MSMIYKFSGNSGLQLPAISFGLWHNFGVTDSYENAREMMRFAFDSGITHFDLANNYGPPPGSAEVTFGKMLKSDFASHRDELLISSKAGHLMWNGPYGDGSSRKSIMVSIDQSLIRTGLDYFDIFYSHRYDGVTPIEETMQALSDIVRQGKALYIGLSKYPYEEGLEAYKILKENKTPCVLYQDRYSMLSRGDVEKQRIPLAADQGAGFIAFSPLGQGLLTDKYLKGIPEDSRAAKDSGFLQREQVTDEVISKVIKLKAIALRRGQNLAQMAIAWVLKNQHTTSVIVGASSVNQLRDNLVSLDCLDFSLEEIIEIDEILA